MWTSDSASKAFYLAQNNCEMGNYEEALKEFDSLLKADPEDYAFFKGFQCSYVLQGAQRLAEVYPPATAIVDEWKSRNAELVDQLEL